MLILTKEVPIKSFDKALLSEVEGFRANDKVLIPFVVSLSNHLCPLGDERNQLVQSFPKYKSHVATR